MSLVNINTQDVSVNSNDHLGGGGNCGLTYVRERGKKEINSHQKELKCGKKKKKRRETERYVSFELRQ